MVIPGKSRKNDKSAVDISLSAADAGTCRQFRELRNAADDTHVADGPGIRLRSRMEPSSDLRLSGLDG